MKEYFISEIDIEKLYHLSDIKIKLDSNKRQHLLLTGKNGSGKTSLLLEIEKFLRAINDEKLSQVFDQYPTWINEAKKKVLSASSDSEKYAADKDLKQCLGFLKKYSDGVQINLNQYEGLEMMYHNGKFITAYFPSERKAQFMRPNGVENITLENTYGIDESAGDILLKYMVHLKTQQAYARNEGDQTTANQIQKWFDRFDSALQILLDEESIHIEYDYKKYDFKIRQNGREPFSFNELSDGYSSVIYIVSDLILRMDKLETHLHIELQKKIFPFLTKFFPKIQFIVTTHSPYILNSISNAKAYDLERQVELDNLSGFSSDDLAEGYFEADAYSDELKNSLNRYEELCLRNDLTEDERAERAEIRIKFKNISTELSGVAKERFEDIERRRKAND